MSENYYDGMAREADEREQHALNQHDALAAKDAEIKVLREEVAILSRGIDRKNAERDFALDEIARLKADREHLITMLANTTNDLRAALAAAVQAEREAIIQFAEYAERVAREKSGEHWEGRSCASFAIANFVRSRGPAPAVDVMAVVRRLVKAWDAEHKRPITDDEWVAGYREVCACIVALRALVSPTTGEKGSQ